MKVKEFVDNFKQASSEKTKSVLITGLNVKTYLPYLDKVNTCERIVNATYYRTNEKTGLKELHINSPANYVLYCLSIIDKYTDLEVDFVNNLEEFDLLNKNEIIDMIISLIPDREMKEFRMVLEMVSEDVRQNEYENHAFIHNEITRFGNLIGTVAEPGLVKLGETIENLDDKQIDTWMKKIKKYIK